MTAMTVALLAILLQGANVQPKEPGVWIVTCDVGAPEGHRVFRMGRKLFQAWNPDQQRFGSNLCESFTCAAGSHKLEGVISSPSLILTVSLDTQAGTAKWRGVGAVGHSRSSGACSIKADAAPSTASP